MRPAKSKPYRRSWKNLLLNKRYQLGFTLFMVGLAALLMSFLGYWVVREAKRATEVAINNVEGQRCPPIPEIGAGNGSRVIIDEITEMKELPKDPPAAAGAAEPAQPAQPVDTAPPAQQPGGTAQPAQSADTAQPEGAGTAAAGQPDAAEAGAGGEVPSEARARPEVILDEGTVLLDVPPTVPPDFAEAVIQHYRCHHERVTKMAGLQTGYQRILGVLVGVGALLIIGLTFTSIKMTHRLAGPLYKVELYFEKMRSGRFDTVYDLRKGDQLVEFYEQFKRAHRGLRVMQEMDIERLREVIEAAEASGLAGRSPEIAATLDELRETLARKEKSIE